MTMKDWLRDWKRRRERWDLEVYLFNCGPANKWMAIRDENTRLGVWKRYPL